MPADRDAPAVAPTDVALRDGATVRVRSAEPADTGRVEAFLRALSPQSIWLRYFSGGVDLEKAARAATERVEGQAVLLAVTGPDERVVGVAQLDRTGARRAEVAFTVADEVRGQGLGTVMLAHLAEVAGSQGIEVLEAEVLQENA